MRPFTYARPLTVEAALQSFAAAPDSFYIGGGTNLIDLMKMGVERPAHLSMFRVCGSKPSKSETADW